ncbi:MAG TPA: signal peptidase II [Bacilli bacterium]|nr:signal peptidase II [Bacilli bacterium]
MKGKNMIIGIILIILFVVIDQVTKFIAFKYFSPMMTYKCIPGVFRISLVENTGGAWGLLNGKMWFFIIVTVIALGIFAYLMKDFNLSTNTMYSVCLILIISGTLGNFIDRLFLGYVRDFLTFDFMSFPSFNFADMCMTIGMILLMFEILFGATGKKWN